MRFLLPFLLIVMLAAGTEVAGAQTTAATCVVRTGSGADFMDPRFVDLWAYIPILTGSLTSCPQTDPATGDTIQTSTVGTWRFRVGTGFATFTKGSGHWALVPQTNPPTVVHWTGPSLDPPPPPPAHPTLSPAQAQQTVTSGTPAVPVVQSDIPANAIAGPTQAPAPTPQMAYAGPTPTGGLITVPNVVGQSAPSAIDTLRSVGLTATIEGVGGGGAPGTVVSQVPRPGQTTPLNLPVEISVVTTGTSNVYLNPPATDLEPASPTQCVTDGAAPVGGQLYDCTYSDGSVVTWWTGATFGGSLSGVRSWADALYVLPDGTQQNGPEHDQVYGLAAPDSTVTCGAPPNPWGYTFCYGGEGVSDPPAGFCAYFNCVSNIGSEPRGWVVECTDGLMSRAGGTTEGCFFDGGVQEQLFHAS